MEHFTQILTNLISSYGLFAVFILMTAESALIPIPSEVTMPFAGVLAGLGYMNIWAAIVVGALGNLIGSLLAYALGYKFNEETIRSYIRRWGKYLLVHEKDFDLAISWFQKYGQGISFGSRLLPIVRTFISLPAGISKMDVKKFSLFTFAGSFIWSAALAFVGLKLGQNWKEIEPFFRKFQFVIIGVFVILGALYIKRHLKNYKS